MNLFYSALSAAAALLLALPVKGIEPLPYPAKPIRLVVPTTAGGPPDLVGRVIGEKLASTLRQPVIIDNRPGATGTIGVAIVAKSTPDGYTLGIIGMPTIVALSLVPKMPYDTERDLAAISLVNWHYHVLAVAASAPVQSVAHLVAAAMAKPGTLRYSSGGNGTPAHLATELLKREARVDISHIPYKGAPAGVQALLAGEVDMMIGSSAVLAPHVKAGKLRGLATPAPQRIAAYPELPTFVELGYPGIRVRDWQGIVAPTGTPPRVIARLYAEIAKVTALADVRQRLAGLGMEAASAGPQQLAAHIQSEIQKWNRLVRETGIRAD